MKLRIRDKDGRLVKVEETKSAAAVKDEDCTKNNLQDGKELTEKDVEKLKKLLPHIDELLAILELGADDGKEDELDYDEDLEAAKEDASETVASEEVVEDDDGEVKEAEEEEEEEEVKVGDSAPSVAKSFGSLRAKTVNDSANTEIDLDAETAEAWNKRYGG